MLTKRSIALVLVKCVTTELHHFDMLGNELMNELRGGSNGHKSEK